MSCSEVQSLSEDAVQLGRSDPRQWQVAHLLTDLYVLLEAYGPFWFTEELHDRLYMSIRLLLESPHNRSK